MLRKVLIIAAAVSMSAASAHAMAPMKGHHMMPMHMMAMCAEGQTKMKCMCGSKNAAMHSKPQVCKAGQWCHTFNGACTM
jgi:hypothetical protein